jgi:hypothetical protein
MRLLVYPTQLILLWYRLPEATVLQMIKGVLSASLTFSGNMTEAHHNWALSGSKLPEIMLLLTALPSDSVPFIFLHSHAT